MTATRSDSISYPPRGMSRNEAARYIGVGATKFDEMVADGRMPRPKRIDGRVIWDRLQLDAAFSDLPDANPINPLDRMLQVDATPPRAGVHRRIRVVPFAPDGKDRPYEPGPRGGSRKPK